MYGNGILIFIKYKGWFDLVLVEILIGYVNLVGCLFFIVLVDFLVLKISFVVLYMYNIICLGWENYR